jgi:hypothetical protein
LSSRRRAARPLPKSAAARCRNSSRRSRCR